MKTREYSFELVDETSLTEAILFFRTYGFCVISGLDKVHDIDIVRSEVIDASALGRRNATRITERIEQGATDDELLHDESVEVRSTGRLNRPLKPVNEIVWMPNFQRVLCDQMVLGPLRLMFGPHFYLHNLHSKIVRVSQGHSSSIELGEDPFGMPRVYNGPEDFRDWHCDWPHDPIAYGGSNPNENVGFIMSDHSDQFVALTSIFYLNDFGERSGGTIVVPASHKDKRKPRDPKSGLNVAKPIDGEIRLCGSKGSVFLMDSRLWHTPPFHNQGTADRVAVVARWAPWWLNTNDYAERSRFNMVNRPVNKLEWSSFPEALRPHTLNLCPEVDNAIHNDLLQVSGAAAESTRKDFMDRAGAKLKADK